MLAIRQVIERALIEKSSHIYAEDKQDRISMPDRTNSVSDAGDEGPPHLEKSEQLQSCNRQYYI